MSETTEPNKKPWTPDVEFSRMAPAAVCGIVSRIVRLREAMNQTGQDGKPIFTPAQLAVLKPVAEPFPFEAEIMSGKMAQVEQAIKSMESTSKRTLRDLLIDLASNVIAGAIIGGFVGLAIKILRLLIP